MKQILFVLIFVLVLLAAHAYGQRNQSMIGEDAPDFALNDLAGNKITLSELQGNFVVIHFAASW